MAIMQPMRLRPAIIPFARVSLILIVAIFILAAIAGLFAQPLSIPALGIAAIISLIILVKLFHLYQIHIANQYIVTDGEITQTVGIFVKNESHVPINKIEDYKVNRTFIGGLLGVADVGIQTARAERGYEIVLQSIETKDLSALESLLENAIAPAASRPPQSP